jgi:spore maturation protein CgeB
MVSVAAPSDRMATRWGDWHLAAALARSLERAGHMTIVETREHRFETRPDADIRLVLRGVERIERADDRLHVLWIISHPESVTTAECDEADLVLVASPRFAATLRARTSTPVEVLLQATDHYRFRPLHRLARRSETRHDVLVVAKTRDVPRPIVLDAIAAGLRPAIYGTGWESFVEPSLVVARHVPNNELPVLYSSAGVVLNDHWSSMRDNGFVSNRILDVLACEVPVVSDRLPEIVELFGDAVPTYADPDELGVIVEASLRDPDEARRRAAKGREIVVAGHTFDRRTRELLAHLQRHGLARPD